MEKVKHIEITNFKSIKHLEINDCNMINVFIGMPNAGKSNILEALANFQYNIENGNRIYNKIDIKKYPLDEIIRYNLISELFFEGNINLKSKIKINDLILSLSYDFKSSNNFNLDDHKFSFEKGSISGNQLLSDQFNDFIKIKFYKFKGFNFENIINQLTSLNHPFGENLTEIIASNPNLRNVVNDLFKQNNLKLLIEKGTNKLKIFKEYQDGTVFSLPYELIADTLQRLIFYKAAIMSNQNSVLLFEEPEAHCFEPYILEFTNAVKYDKNNNQFFIVTHSDFIIQEFLRDKESKKNTTIYLVNNVDGETKLKLLDKNKNEDVYEFGMNPFFNFENLWENN